MAHNAQLCVCDIFFYLAILYRTCSAVTAVCYRQWGSNCAALRVVYYILCACLSVRVGGCVCVAGGKSGLLVFFRR